MAIETELTMNTKPFEEALGNAEKQAAQSAGKMNKSLSNVGKKDTTKGLSEKMDQTGKAIDKGTGALDKFSGALGGASTGLGGFGAALMDIVTNPIAAIGAALVALAAVCVTVWDKMTLSAEEYAYKLSKVSAEATKTRQDLEKQQSADISYMDRLQELSKIEINSNERKKEASVLIEMLTKRYGDLGIAIDSATGKISGLDIAQRKMLVKQTQARIKALQDEKKALEAQGRTQADVSISSILPASWLMKHSNAGLDIRKQVQNAIQNNDLETQIKIFEKIRDTMNTQEDIDAIQKIIDLKKQEFEIQKQIKELQDSGFASEKEQAEALRKATQASKQAETAALKKEQEKKNKEDQYNSAVKIDEKIKFKQHDFDEEKKKGDEIQQKLDDLQKRRQAILDANLNDRASQKYVEENFDPEIVDLQLQMEKSKTKQADIQREINKLEQVSKDYYKNMLESLDNDIEVQKLKLQGLDEEAERQRIINDLKQKGLKVDQAELDKIMEKKKELAGLMLAKDLNKQFDDLQHQAEKKFGNVKQAEIDKAKRDAREKKGSDLTDEEEKRIEKLVELQMKLNNFPQLSLQGLDIKTNSLTSRGGFQTGAVETNTDRINNQIANYNKAQCDLLNQIKQEIAKARTI